MPTCIICLNSLKSPAALPCGHVFCYECIVKVVHNIQPYTHQHFCPTCRNPYTISHIDPSLLPAHLRQHFTPSIRKLNLDFSVPSPATSTSPTSEIERLRAENASLRTCCEVWRKRAGVHAAATLGLVGLARMARDHAIKMKQERAELEQKFVSLKRKYEDTDHPSLYPPTPSESYKASPETLPHSPPESHQSFRSYSPCPSDDSYCSDCPDCQPVRKRQRSSSSLPFIKRSPSPPASILLRSPQPLPPPTPADVETHA